MNITWTITKQRGNSRPVLTYTLTLEEHEKALALSPLRVESSIPEPEASWQEFCYPDQYERCTPTGEGSSEAGVDASTVSGESVAAVGAEVGANTDADTASGTLADAVSGDASHAVSGVAAASVSESVSGTASDAVSETASGIASNTASNAASGAVSANSTKQRYYVLDVPSHKGRSWPQTLRLPWRADNAYPEVEASFLKLREVFEQHLAQAYASQPMQEEASLESTLNARRHVAPAVLGKRFVQFARASQQRHANAP